MASIKIFGPFWQASANIIQIEQAGAPAFFALRKLFIDHPAEVPALGDPNTLPGTSLAICTIAEVNMQLPTGELSWSMTEAVVNAGTDLAVQIRQGKLSLLLLRSMETPTGSYRCLQGYIPLPDHAAATTSLLSILGLKADLPLGDRIGKSVLPGRLIVHSSGLSVFGGMHLALEKDNMLPGVFKLSAQQNPATSDFQMTLEKEQLTAEESKNWLESWARLGQLINPIGPQWVSLEAINTGAIPGLMWLFSQRQTDAWPVLFQPGSFQLYLTDRALNVEGAVPNSIASIQPEVVRISKEGDNVILELGNTDNHPEKAVYSGFQQNNDWSESLEFSNLTLGCDAPAVARQLRRQQELPVPELNKGLLDSSIVWGYAPLAEGWAELPFANLTEQLYVDLGLQTPKEKYDPNAGRNEAFRGGLILGNEEYNRAVYKQSKRPEETPWELALFNTGRIHGRWTLQNDTQTNLLLTQIDLTLYEPEISLNGFLWLSGSRPSLDDAIPDLDNWIGGLFPVNLISFRENKSLFPAPLMVQFDSLHMAAQKGTDQPPVRIGAWSYQYVFRKDFLENDSVKNAMPTLLTPEIRRSHVWLHHPTLPMIQALPLTQNRRPARYPAASRQLAPFEFADANNALKVVSMGSEGMSNWPGIPNPRSLTPAHAWGEQSDLPMASLSLPGLFLLPGNQVAAVSPFDALISAYRTDLPYADEQYALAQLPKAPSQAGEMAPPVDSAQPSPELPLRRASFAQHWRRLSEMGSLAAADAVVVFRKTNGNAIVLRNLVEPLEWAATLQLDLSAYPGAIQVAVPNSGADETVFLFEKEKALRGFHGRLKINIPESQSFPHVAIPSAFDLTANAMHAQAASIRLTADDQRAALLDQRGLYRSATKEARLLIQTPLALHEAQGMDIVLLSSLRQSLLINVLGHTWQFWMKDVPVRQTDHVFERLSDNNSNLSPQRQDVNDPEAHGKKYNYRQGYEWRLGDDNSATLGFLPLGKLHFYPLTLEKIALQNGGVAVIEMEGRLQLPLLNNREQENLSNVVRLHFSDTNGALELESIQVVSEQMEWPLEQSDTSPGAAPRLCFTQVQLEGPSLKIVDPAVRFLLFDAEWRIPIKPMLLGQALPWTSENQDAMQPLGQGFGIGVESVQLALFQNEQPILHALQANLRFQLGQFERLTINGLLAFPLTGPEAGITPGISEGQLFDDLHIRKATVMYTRQAIQFQWEQTEKTTSAPLAFLPGWLIDESAGTPGFAAFRFSALAQSDKTMPRLQLESAFVETLLPCRWGNFLQDPLPERATPEQAAARIFDSSAGRLSIGITVEYRDEKWTESYLLNGYLEIRNQISWPGGLRRNGFQLALQTPLGQADSLNHFRHSLRVLLNQHNLPADLLASQAAGNQLFSFAADQIWQFPAVAEHQLVEVTGLQRETPQAPIHAEVREICRWTALQEIRLIAPHRFRGLLEYLNGKILGPDNDSDNAVDPPILLPGAGSPNDMLSLTGRLLNEVGRGVPNLRVELWRFEGPVVSLIKFTSTDASGRFKFSVKRADVQVLDSQAQARFMELRLEISLNGKKIIKKEDKTGQWLLNKIGTNIQLGIPFQAPPIQLYGNAFSERLEAALTGRDADLMVVEASAPFCINLTPLASTQPAPLQFLPTGAQTAVLASPADFGISSPTDPMWQMLVMPFIGLFQSPDPARTSVLDKDPVVQLFEKQKTALSLGFTSQSATAYAIPVTAIDFAETNRWPRLDQNMLEESWFRLFHPKAETLPGRLPSVMAALPDTPARLSRASALAQAFRGSRLHFPPASDTRQGEPFGLSDTLVWRDDSLIQFDFAGDRDKTKTSAMPFALFALSLSALTGSEGENRYAAATILPSPKQDSLPQALAIPPYLSLGFAPSPQNIEALDLKLISGELLCLDKASGQFLPVASKLIEQTDDGGDLIAGLVQWARDVQALVSPDSPLAVLRLREIRQNTNPLAGETSLVTTYSFRVVQPVNGSGLVRQVFHLRSKPAQLRFREGHFGGFSLPEALQGYELAPPLVRGVQPVYLDNWDTEGIDPNLPIGEWPWGLSGIRLKLQITESGQGISGPTPTETPALLWWQGLQHFVQFRAASADQPSAGLPELFRARAIRSMMPALPDVPMPALTASGDGAWQSALPGELHIMPVGSRAGVAFAYRHQLIRQQGNGSVTVSGSVPVQHRFPRPVSLPPNRPGRREWALRPWAGYFKTTEHAYVADQPMDEAFFADGSGAPARALNLRLLTPMRGELKPDWDGSLVFECQTLLENNASFQPDWVLGAILEVEGVGFAFNTAGIQADQQSEFIPANFDPARLRTALEKQASGQAILFRVTVEEKSGAPGFRQTLEFPLYWSPGEVAILPLAPRFIHFEDPEYNRQLASASGNALGQLLIDNTLYTLRLSSDRKVYNPDSQIALRYDWLGGAPPAGVFEVRRLHFKRVSAGSGAVNILKTMDHPLEKILMTESLVEITSDSARLLIPGESLQLELVVAVRIPGTAADFMENPVVLSLDIVRNSVIPETASAYALLRSRGNSGAVDCPRFAWGPAATRIDMVNPDDLLQEMVRRRAVFHWRDTVRAGLAEVQYQVQKISVGGSTHFPFF